VFVCGYVYVLLVLLVALLPILGQLELSILFCPHITLQILVYLARINHNYCKPHSGLPNQVTPAVAASIDLKLGDNKLGDLITRSASAKDQEKKELELEPQLGKRTEYIDIKREADCISIKPKAWLPKPVWRQINDILFINGFHWLENGKDSQWTLMKSYIYMAGLICMIIKPRL
jgi:hypothetical protein